MKKLLTFLMLCGAMLLRAESQEELFERTVKHLDKGGLTFQYQNLENLNKQVASLLDIFSKTYVNDSTQQMIFNNVLMLVNSMKFDDLQSFGSSTKQLAPRLYANKLFTAVKPQAVGTLCALSGKNNVKFAIGSELPASTIFALGAYMDWNNFFSVIERSFANKNEFNNFMLMFEQSVGIKVPELMKNCTGEFFGGIFKGNKKKELHFVAVIPDNQGKLKLLAQRYLGAALRQNKNGSATFEMPVAASDFGSGVTVLFVQNKVCIYNSNAPFYTLLKCGAKGRKLADSVPQIFGMLKNVAGNSYIVMNLDVKDIDSSLDSHVYRYGAVCNYIDNGYFVSGRSDFNLQDVSEYVNLFGLLPSLNNDSTNVIPVTGQN